MLKKINNFLIVHYKMLFILATIIYPLPLKQEMIFYDKIRDNYDIKVSYYSYLHINMLS